MDEAYAFVSSRPAVASSFTAPVPFASTSTAAVAAADADSRMEEVEGREVVLEEKENRVVLQFTFNDGELKSANGVGKVMNRRKYKYAFSFPSHPSRCCSFDED